MGKRANIKNLILHGNKASSKELAEACVLVEAERDEAKGELSEDRKALEAEEKKLAFGDSDKDAVKRLHQEIRNHESRLQGLSGALEDLRGLIKKALERELGEEIEGHKKNFLEQAKRRKMLEKEYWKLVARVRVIYGELYLSTPLHPRVPSQWTPNIGALPSEYAQLFREEFDRFQEERGVKGVDSVRDSIQKSKARITKLSGMVVIDEDVERAIKSARGIAG